MRDRTSDHESGGRPWFLHSAMSGAIVGVAAQAGIQLAGTERLSAQTNLTPDTALREPPCR